MKNTRGGHRIGTVKGRTSSADKVILGAPEVKVEEIQVPIRPLRKYLSALSTLGDETVSFGVLILAIRAIVKEDKAID